jgi:sugar lactone lactonase YvrE
MQPREGQVGPSASARIASTLVLAALLAVAVSLAGAEQASAAKLRGKVVSGGIRLDSTPVTLYRAGSSQAPSPTRLGGSRTRGNGTFKIGYRAPESSSAVLYLIAGRGAAVRLASVLGTGGLPRNVVVNEHTTVATGYALAQFLHGSKRIAGGRPGLQNAAAMAKNLVDVRTGHLGRVLRRAPNGDQTSTLQTFNSLSNMLPRCARSPFRCSFFFGLAKPPGGSAPRGTLEAVAEIARNPGHAVKRLFKFAGSAPVPYRPALAQDRRPDAWTLPLRFDGDGMSIDGPGNFAIDGEGNLWVNNNYVFSADPLSPACGSDLLFKFTPRGRFAPDSPYTGGGLNGAGFGITIAPNGKIWVGNFGFAGIGCTEPVPANSVSEFTPEGDPLSPNATPTSTGGYTQGPIDAPQGTVADRDGNIWIANCGNDTVTQYPGGDPSRARVSAGIGIESPFGIAINQRGQAFVAGNGNSRVAMLNPDGSPTSVSPISGGGINRPMGVAVDSRGNIWVANFAVPFICHPPTPPFPPGGSATLLGSEGVPDPGSPFRGGGLRAPWGITVDGDDNVWVANFDGQRVSQLCGKRTKHCPPGAETGDPIAPDSGYGFDGLTRNTGIGIDPSGNVWLANNWTQAALQTNPGGHQIVAFVGAAAPLKTPLIGPPR